MTFASSELDHVAGQVLEPEGAPPVCLGRSARTPYHRLHPPFDSTMSYRETEHLRVLIANERRDARVPGTRFK